MSRSYSPEFRRKVLDLIATGRTVAQVAHDLEVGAQTIYTWRRQEQVDSGHRRATELLKGAVRPKARFAAVAAMVEQSLPIQVACRVLGLSESGFHAWPSPAR